MGCSVGCGEAAVSKDGSRRSPFLSMGSIRFGDRPGMGEQAMTIPKFHFESNLAFDLFRDGSALVGHRRTRGVQQERES